jgi:4-amino-4-deoxy-L-arabinose transferase-like glycosyltransferase
MKSATQRMPHVLMWTLAIVVLISHIAYAIATRQYPQWDEHNYLSLAIKYYDIWRTPSWDIYPRMLESSGYLQPVYSSSIAFLLLLFGTTHTYLIALLLNAWLFALSVIGVFFLAKKFFDANVAFVSSVVFACLGNAVFYSRFAYTETAVTTAIVWALVWLVKTDHFSRTKDVIIAGLLFAMAILVRWIAVVFLIGPVLVYIIEAIVSLYRGRKPYAKAIQMIIFYMVLAFGIPVLVYFWPNWQEFFSYAQRNQTHAAEWVAQYRFAEMANTFSTRSIMYYFNILSQNTIGIFFAFALGYLVSVWFFRKTAFLLAGFLVPYMFLTFVAVWKEDRFLVPLYPVFAIIASSVVIAFRAKAWRLVISLFLLTLSFLNVIGASWGVGPMGARGLTDVVLPEFIHHPRRVYLTPLVWPPTKELVKAQEIVRIIAETSEQESPIVVGAFTFEPLDNALGSLVNYHYRDAMRYQKPPTDLSRAQYILTKSNDPSMVDTTGFRSIANIAIPMDNSTVTIHTYETH